MNKIVKAGLFLSSIITFVFQHTKAGIAQVIAKIRARVSNRAGPTYSSLMHHQFSNETDNLHDEGIDDLSSSVIQGDNLDIEDEVVPSTQQEHASYTDQPAGNDVPNTLLAHSEEDANRPDSVDPHGHDK